jgi:long-chain acyl-CoA synthetase
MGNGLPQTALLVQLSAEGRAADADTLEEQLRRQVLAVNAELDSHARIACVLIVKDEWSSANGMATHTLKIKRSTIEKQYRSQVENAFSGGASVKTPLAIWESATDETISLQA